MRPQTWILAWLSCWLFATTALAAPPEDEWADEGEWVEQPAAGEDGGEWGEQPAADDGEWVEQPAGEDGGEWGEEPPVPENTDDGGEWGEQPAVPENADDGGEWVEQPGGENPGVDPSWAGEAEAPGDAVDPVYYEPGAELSDEELEALTAMLEHQLGDSAAVQQLAASGYVLCNPQAPREQLVECIRGNLGIAEAQVRAKALAQLEERDANRLGTIGIVVFFAGFAGLFLLATPLVLRKRYPDQSRRLWGFSVLATFLFMVNMFLFSVALFILRIVQSVGSQEISPKLAMVDASFTVLKEQAGELVELFPVLFEPTVVQLAEGSDKDMTVLLLENIAKIQSDVAVFKRFAGVFEAVNSVMDYSDVAFSLVAVVVFAIGFKDVFLDIIKLPLRAVQAPNERAGRTIARTSLARSLREMLVVLVMIFVILMLTAIAGVTMRAAVGPAIEALLAFVVLGVFHVQLTPDASTAAIGLGLGSVALILLLNIAVVLISNVLFLSRAQKLVRARMQWKVPLRQNWKFFVYGLLIVVGVQLLPWVYLEIANVVFDATLGGLLDGDDPPIGFVLAFGGVTLLGFWVLAFWGARGVAGLRYLVKYPLPKPPSAEPDASDEGPGSDEPPASEPPAAEADGASWHPAQ